MFRNSSYTWTIHVEMGRVDIGSFGLFVTNLQALHTFDETICNQFYRLVHGLYGDFIICIQSFSSYVAPLAINKDPLEMNRCVDKYEWILRTHNRLC